MPEKSSRLLDEAACRARQNESPDKKMEYKLCNILFCSFVIHIIAVNILVQ